MASALETAKETYKRKKFRATLDPLDQQQLSQSNLQVLTPPNEVSF